MGQAKSEEFSVRDNRIAGYARALGHPARIAILRILIRRETCICGDLVDDLPLSQSTVSQHLKALKEAGLIKGDIEGTRVCYCIDGKAWREAQSCLSGLFSGYRETGQGCC